MNLQQIRNRPRSNSRERSRSRQKSESSHSRGGNYKEDQEQFEANQQIIRSLLRIEQNREQPIDRFVKVVWIYKEKLSFDHKSEEIMKEPKSFLKKLTMHQLEELENFTNTFEKTQKKLNSSYVNYWIALRAIISAIRLQKNGENVINQNFKAKIDEILAKPYEELLKMQKAIQATLSIRSGSDNAFWNTINMKIELRKRQMQLTQFYSAYKNAHKEQQGNAQEQDSIELQEPISPILGPISLVNQKLITLEQNQLAQRQAMAEKIFKDEFEKSRQKLQENLSLPKNHNLLSTAIINESTVAYDYITKEIIQFEKYKRMQQDEQEFDEWVPCDTQGRFRDRKPQYINRKRVTIEWNKYNTMHYNEDNPPPKTIQGYKFNIFFPDLYDKQKTPQYYLETTESPDYCLIKFKAGPPYKDIAFKILRKQWDFTEKSGFESIFHRGILQLYFNFKKPKFRI